MNCTRWVHINIPKPVSSPLVFRKLNGGFKILGLFGTTGRGCFRSDTVFVDCYLGFWTNNCVLLPLYLWYWGLINGSTIDGIKNSIWTEWKCIFYVIINGWPIAMSSHPTPRVGCAIVGLAILVHDSRQSELDSEATRDLIVPRACAVRGAKKFGGIFGKS